MRFRIRPTVRGVVSVALAFGAVELGVRLFGHAPNFSRLDPQIAGLRMPHSTRGFSYRPGFVRAYESMKQGDYAYEIRINELGLRSSRPMDAGPFDHPTVLVVGEDFTEAWGVSDEHAWPRVMETTLGDTPRVHVINAGVSGYNLDQIQDLTTDLLDVIKPTIVILGLRAESKGWMLDPLTVVGDVDIQCSLAPRVHPIDGGYVLDPDARSRIAPLEVFFNRFWHTAGWMLRGARRGRDALTAASGRLPSAVSGSGTVALDLDEAFQRLIVQLQAFHDLLSGRDVPLLVVLLNSQSPLGGFTERETAQNAEVQRLGLQRGFEVVDALPLLVETAGGRPIHRFSGSYHWPPSTHELVARLVATRIRRSKLLD
jgi:hypothetical protein